MKQASGFERKEAVLIINPAAHNVPSLKRIWEAEDWLREHGWRFRWEQTTGPGQATQFAAHAAREGMPVVIACGGDGTLNEVANGLAGTQTAMGTLPFGTSNIWAREMEISRKPIEATMQMATGEVRTIDLGKAGDRYFLLFAGFGIDAKVTAGVSLAVKQYIGAAAYGLSAAREVVRWRPRPTTVRLDDEVHHVNVLMAFAGNTRLYAGLTKITPKAFADDGLLDVCIYEGKGRLEMATHALRTVTQRHPRASNVIYRRVKRLEFEWGEKSLPAQVDGDALKERPTVVEVAPAALKVVVPAGLKTPLFCGREQEAERLTAELTLPQPRTG
ncbi:MAG TPA: diacylglycerol kinase family protein [Dehalococcoidia bacterium]|nr:diacylglycerol kinase family protein [Dehalococcoidia bacterium]